MLISFCKEQLMYLIRVRWETRHEFKPRMNPGRKFQHPLPNLQLMPIQKGSKVERRGSRAFDREDGHGSDRQCRRKPLIMRTKEETHGTKVPIQEARPYLDFLPIFLRASLLPRRSHGTLSGSVSQYLTPT